jgi:hypothetical protein
MKVCKEFLLGYPAFYCALFCGERQNSSFTHVTYCGRLLARSNPDGRRLCRRNKEEKEEEDCRLLHIAQHNFSGRLHCTAKKSSKAKLDVLLHCKHSNTV